MNLESKKQSVTEERLRLSKRFELRLGSLRSQHLSALNNHLGNDIRDVADEGVLALTSLAEFVAKEHVSFVKKRGMLETTRDAWLLFVHQEMSLMYDLCSRAVLETTDQLAGKRTGVVEASLDFLNEQSRSYVKFLESMLAIESEPKDARSFAERLLGIFDRRSGAHSFRQ